LGCRRCIRTTGTRSSRLRSDEHRDQLAYRLKFERAHVFGGRADGRPGGEPLSQFRFLGLGLAAQRRVPALPGLKTAFSEGQAGWLPYLLSRLDTLWHTGAPLVGFDRVDEPPSHYVADHVYACIFDDPSAILLAAHAGEDPNLPGHRRQSHDRN